MSNRRISVRTSIAPGWRLLRCALGALLLAGSMLGQVSLAADGSSAQIATLTPLQPDAGPASVGAGADVALAAVKKIDGQGVAGQKIDWTVAGPAQATLTPLSSTTSAQSVTGDAGIATTVFNAVTPGSYVVTATTQKNPACTTAACATYISIRYEVNVTADVADASVKPSGINKTEVIGAIVAVGAGVALAANNGNGHSTASILHTLTNAGGDGQSANANSPLAQPLLVHATNDGANVAGVGIHWTVSGGGTLSAPLSFTDANGVASIRVVNVGPGPGPVIVTATRADAADATVHFTVNVNQPPAPSLNIVSGDGQSGSANTRVANPLVVEADLGNAPQANIPINWAVTSGDATITSVSNGGNTNAAGQSRAFIKFGPTAGPVDITATRTDNGLSQTFHLNSVITNSLTIVSGDNQSGPPNAPLPQRLVVYAQTNGHNAAGVTINWSASGGATLSSTTSVTSSAGLAGVRVINTGSGLGPIIVTATRADDPSASVQFTENILAPTMSRVSGNGQSGLIGTAAAAMLVAQLKDGAGVALSGQTVTWVVTSGSATLSTSTTTTDSSGNATISFTYGNSTAPITIRASAFGGLAFVDFSETPVTANALLRISGNAQTGAPGTRLPLDLVVRIQPPPGSPVLSGVPINFTVVSGSATVTVSSTMTDGSGQASTKVDLGLTPGKVKVLAQVSGGGPSTTFTETISGSLVSSVLTIAAGDKQVIAPNTPSQPLVVQLEGSGSPLVGQTIDWSSTSGTLSATSSSTDANGKASVTITPTTTGAITVTASFAGFAQYTGTQVAFSENTTLSSIPTLTTNDQSIGAALDSACTALSGIPNRTQQQQDLLNQCLALNASSGVSTAATAIAIHQLLPSVAETQTQTAATATTTQFDNLAGRMNALRGGAHGASFSGLSFNGTNGSLPLSDVGAALLGVNDKPKQDDATAFSRWGAFASGQIGRQEANAQGATPGYNLDIHGLTFGVDYRENSNLVLGAALGYTRQTTNLNGGQGDLSMNGWSLSGYATWYRQSNWYLDSSLTWSNNNFDSRRHIGFALPQPDGSTVFVDQLARATSGGNALGGSLTFGRDFNRKAWASGLYGKVQYSHQNFDAFHEQLNTALPGSGLGLRVDSRTQTSVASVLGGKIDYNHSTGWGVLIPHAEFEWQHEFRSDPNAFRAFFIDDPSGTPILITGDALDSDFFRLGLGMSFVFPHGRSGFILYDKTLGRSGTTEDNLSIGFRMEF